MPGFDILQLFNRLAASCKARTLRKTEFAKQFVQLFFPPVGKAPAISCPKSFFAGGFSAVGDTFSSLKANAARFVGNLVR